MVEKGRISARQFMIIVMLFTIGSSIIITPSIMAGIAKQDAWIASLIGVIISSLILWLFTSLANLYPDKTIVEYSELIFGKWAGKVFSAFFLLYFLLLSALLLNGIGEFITIQVMPETPASALHILFLIIVIVGTRLGIEPVSRSMEIFVTWVMGLLIISVILLYPEIKLDNMLPVMEDGIKPWFKAAYPYIGVTFMELIVFLMVYPYINQEEKVKKAKIAFYLGTFSGGIVISIIVLLSILILGANQMELQIHPSYLLAKKINVAQFLQRVEIIMAFLWFITLYLKLTICFYATVLGIAQLFQLNDYRFLSFPLGFILIPLSQLVVDNIVNLHWVAEHLWPCYSLIQCIFLPLLMLIVAYIRNKIGTGRGKVNEKNV